MTMLTSKSPEFSAERQLGESMNICVEKFNTLTCLTLCKLYLVASLLLCALLGFCIYNEGPSPGTQINQKYASVTILLQRHV